MLQAVAALLEQIDVRRYELGQGIELFHTNVLSPVNEENCIAVSPPDLKEAPRWIRYDSAQTHLERYRRDGDAFLCRIIALDEAWARSYEPQLNPKSRVITSTPKKSS